MAKSNKNYSIESARLHNWDYAQAAAYFVTIGTANTEYFFVGYGSEKKSQFWLAGDVS